MGKWWDRDRRDMTMLESVFAPISPSSLNSMYSNKPRAYQYYDTPDGQDCWKKLWVTAKWGTGTGALAGFMYVRLYSTQTTALQALNRFAYFFVPCTTMFMTYAAITYAATNIRGKDDVLNSTIGGAVAGSLAGVWLKSGPTGTCVAVLTAALCSWRKYCNQSGYTMLNPAVISTQYNSSRDPGLFDFTLTPVGNKGWTTGAE